MSKLKKRIILVCVVLALLLSGTAAMFAFAADTVPMPKDTGLARMRKDIYEMYLEKKGNESFKDLFDEYARAFEINDHVNIDGRMVLGRISITKAPKSKGSTATTVQFEDSSTMNVSLPSTVAYSEEMVNNFELRQNFYLTTRSFGGGWYRMKMGWSIYDDEILPNVLTAYSGEAETLLPGSRLYKGGAYNGKYTWNVEVNGYGSASNFSYHLLDHGNAGKNGWTVELEETGDHTADGKTVYQLIIRDKNGDQFRPANSSITYEELETLQLNVTMKSTDTLSDGKVYTFPAKAVEIREKVTSDQGYPSAIVFEFYGEEWLNLEDQVVITGVEAVHVLPEGEEAPTYEIEDLYDQNRNLTKDFGVTSATPVTDFAGNEILWEGTSFELKDEMTMDRLEAKVVGVELSFSNFTSPEGSTEAGYAESFSGPWDYITLPCLIMNEEMHYNKETMRDVQIQLNLRDSDGNPVTSHLDAILNYTNRDGIVYSVLRFDTVFIDKGMTPQGEQIVVEKVINEHLLQDRVGNLNLNNDILMTGVKETSIWPEQVSFLDTVGPDVTLQDPVVRQKVSTESGNLESIQITVPFRVTDHDPGTGLMRSTASGTTAQLRLSNPEDGQAIEYRYAITYTTDFPASDAAGVDWYTGNLGGTNHSGWATFGVGEENTNMYLHMELSNLAGYEINEKTGLEMTLDIEDMAKNSTVVTENIPISGIDNVGPQIVLDEREISVDADGVTFAATVEVTDTNGINSVEYRFADSEEDTETAYSALYHNTDNQNYETAWSDVIDVEFTQSGQIDKILQIRAYDKNNNPSIVSMPFSADLNKVISNYTLTQNIFEPSDQSGIQISEPVFNGTLSENAATRVTVVIPGENADYSDYQIYFRVIPVSQMTDSVKALDPSATWYKAGKVIQPSQLGYYVYHDVTKVEGQPGWVSHYGQMDVYIGSSNMKMDNITSTTVDGVTNTSLILEPGYSNGSGESSTYDPTYSWSKIGTVSHASSQNNIYSMSYDLVSNGSSKVLKLKDSQGVEVTGQVERDDSSGVKYRYAKFDQSICGVRVGMTLANTVVADWGVDGIDFANSYAVLVRANADGTLITDDAGNYDEVTGHVPLSNSLKQTLTVPNVAREGESFTSGVYTWVVHVAQKGGGVSEFATGEVYLILDNAEVPENFGVLEHTTRIQVVDGYYDHQYVESTRKPEDGQTRLSVINIGIAKPTALMVEEPREDGYVAYVYSETLQPVTIDGSTAYLKGVANSSEYDSSYQNSQMGTFTITADMTNSGYGTFLGEEVGTVQGIRFWNKANVTDYSKIAYIQKDQRYSDSSIRAVSAEFSQENGVAKLDVSFNVAWYMPDGNPLYESAQALKEALPNGNFGLIDGENTICYQLLMNNGKESPIYQFKLNLVKEVPAVNVDFAYGPSYIDAIDQSRYVEYVDVNFSDMFSVYSGLEVYHVQHDKNASDDFFYYTIKQLTDDEIVNGYRIDRGCSGYDRDYGYDNFGYQGTSITGRFECKGSESFFVILDHSGNAVTVYPMDSTMKVSETYGTPDVYVKNQTFTKFMPDKVSYLTETVHGMHQVQLTYQDTNYSGEMVDARARLDLHDRIEFRIDADRASTDEEKEALWVSHIVDNESVSVPNSSGFGDVEPSYYGTLGFAVPYDPNAGDSAEHTVDVRVKGAPNSDGQPNYVWEGSVTFTAPNVKPAVAKVEAKAGCIEITYTTAVVTENGASNVERIPVTDPGFYGSEYVHTFQDLFGNSYTQTLQIPPMPSDITVTYALENSTEAYDPGVGTTGKVVITVETTNENYDLLVDTMDIDSEQIEIQGNESKRLIITTAVNTQLDVYYTDRNYATNDPYAAYLEVRNIYKTAAVDPYISWDYNAGDIEAGNVVYGNVTAHLVDRNGQALLDPATGEPAKFTFYPGGPKEYTFTGCYSHATNTPVPDVTATLEVTLMPEPIAEKDTAAPDVDIVAYLKPSNSAAKAANLVYRKDSGRFAMTDYAFIYGLTDEEVYYDDINEMIANMGWSDSYMFHLDVHDESRVKIILKDSIYASGVNYQSNSDTIEGVTLVGRTLQVTKNCEFALYIVDEENNITAVHVNISNLTAAPVPELAMVESKTAEGKPAIRVYLLPPQITNCENLMITNTGAVTDDEEFEGVKSDYFGLDYMLYESSGTKTIYYSYEVPGYDDPFTGTLEADVKVPVLTTPAVENQVWSANYFNSFTNQDILLHLDLNTSVKSASVVYTVGQDDNRVADTVLEEAGLYVSAFRNDVSIVYENNTTQLLAELATQFGDGELRLMMTEMEYGTVGYYNIPKVTSIDRVGPELDGDAVIDVNQDNYKSAVVTLNLKETALSGDGRFKGTQFQYTVRENGTYTYSFVDEAGNRSSFHVEVTDLITEPLTITLSTSTSDAGIITDPSTYKAEVGQTLYARVNRDATISVYGKDGADTEIKAAKDSWQEVTVTENSMGMHPSVVARDNYGNLAIVQLEYIPIKDVTAPAAFLHRDTVSVAATVTDEEIRTVLMENILYSDDKTAAADLKVTIDYDKIASGRTVATYTVTDEEGNATVRQCYLRIRSGLEPVIHVNGQLVEDGAFLYVTDKNDLEITVAFDGEVAEPYKLVYEEGDLRSWAKMKDGTWLTAGYDAPASQTYQAADLGDGWYSFALTTQGMEVYYFQVHIGQVS